MKNEVEQKAARLQFWKYNKNRNWNNVFFTDESSFYLRSPGINRWVPKNENNYVEKSKYTKKIHVWGAFWSKGVVKLKFFEGNMDSAKYIDILESSFDEMNSILPKGWIYSEIMIQNINQNTLFAFIFKKKEDKIDEMASL